jgi:UDP-2,4-diacetamido-2,4,6-trideoxy-beta-L-altropyranose hydrolase
MENKILIFVGIYLKGGTGNAQRMYALSKYIKNRDPKVLIDFVTNDNQKFLKIFWHNNDISLLNLTDLSGKYDIALYDSFRNDSDILIILKKYSEKIIAFDYFDYSANLVDSIINLYNQKAERIDQFKGPIFDGVKFAILRDEIIESKMNQENRSYIDGQKVLVTFGGEDPNGNTVKTLDLINQTDLIGTVILGSLNKVRTKALEKYERQFTILSHVDDMNNYYNMHDIIICGGGTTLLEVLYLGKPVIAVPQNELEDMFIKYIKKYIQLYNLEDITEVMKINENMANKSELYTKYTSLVDGKGKERIYDIIMETK